MTDAPQAPAPTETVPTTATTPEPTPTEPTPSLLNQPDSVEGEGTPEAPPAKEEPSPAPEFKLDELKLPEGMTISEDIGKKLTDLATELKLPTEGVQKLTDLHTEALKAAAAQPYELWTKTQSDWVAAVKADPEIGGAKLTEVKASIGKLLSNSDLIDPGFKQAMDFTGAGNNPAFIKTLYKISQVLNEGKAVGGNPPSTPKSAAEILYPNQGKG